MNSIPIAAIVIAAIVLIFVAFVLVKLSQKWSSGDVDYPYQGAGPLFTSAERSFYGVLSQAVGTNATIFGKVRVADTVIPRKGLSRSEWQKAFNKISGKHFDFLICNNDDLSVICAMELDDSSHKSDKRQRRDEFLRGVCGAAHIPLVQIPARASYGIDEIRKLLAPHLNVSGPTHEEEVVSAKHSDSDEKVCPKCSSSMVVRIAKKGNNAGKKFWACSSYPKCRQVEAIGA